MFIPSLSASCLGSFLIITDIKDDILAKCIGASVIYTAVNNFLFTTLELYDPHFLRLRI